MAILKTISIVTVRAQDVPPVSVVRFEPGTIYYQPVVYSGVFQKWERADDSHASQVRGWVLLYDIDNGDGIDEVEKWRDGLHDSFIMFRLPIDDPNASENDDRTIAVERNQLVSVQVPSTED